MIDMSLYYIDYESLWSHNFISCFCSAVDLLSQWRGYAGKGTGYAIHLRPKVATIDATKLVLSKLSVPPAPLNLLFDLNYKWIQLNYDKGAHESLFKEMIQSAIDAVKTACGTEFPAVDFGDPLLSANELSQPTPDQLDEAKEKIAAPVASALVVSLFQCFCRMKHPKFIEEQEWRILYYEEKGKGILDKKFRVSGGLLVPFVELPFLEVNKIELFDVVGVMCGPTQVPQLTKQAFEEFLAQQSYSGVSVTNSAIPLRV